MSRSEERRRPAIAVPTGVTWGIVFAFAAAMISGLAIFVNASAVKQLPDAAVYTTLKNGVAAIVLIAGALAVGGFDRPARTAVRRHVVPVVAVGVVGGSVPFILFFTGLAQASAPSAAFIQKTLFVWVALLAVPLLGERLGPAPIAALAILVIGQALVLPPADVRWGTGETLILAATLLWAVETVLVKRLLADVPTPTMAAVRMGIGLVVLVGYLAVSGRLPVVAGLTPAQWTWALATGVILAAYVGTWFAALRRAPATVVTSVLVVGAVVTGVLSGLSKGALPAPEVVGGYAMIVVAATTLAGWCLLRERPASTAVPAGVPTA